MRRVAIVSVRLELVAPPETGVWCPTCALPSRMRGVGALSIGDTLQGLITVETCAECGADEVV